MTSDFRSGSQSSQRIRGFADCRLERTRKNADHPAPALSPLFHVVQLQRSKQSMMFLRSLSYSRTLAFFPLKIKHLAAATSLYLPVHINRAAWRAEGTIFRGLRCQFMA